MAAVEKPCPATCSQTLVEKILKERNVDDAVALLRKYTALTIAVNTTAFGLVSLPESCRIIVKGTASNFKIRQDKHEKTVVCGAQHAARLFADAIGLAEAGQLPVEGTIISVRAFAELKLLGNAIVATLALAKGYLFASISDKKVQHTQTYIKTLTFISVIVLNLPLGPTQKKCAAYVIHAVSLGQGDGWMRGFTSEKAKAYAKEMKDKVRPATQTHPSQSPPEPKPAQHPPEPNQR